LSNATICPVILICNTTTEPEVFDSTCMSFVARHIKFCTENNLKIEVCAQILEIITGLFPWLKMGDEKWKQYLLTWWNGVIRELERYASNRISSANSGNQNIQGFQCEIKHHMKLHNLFGHWLIDWRNGHKYRALYDKGIGANNCSIINNSHVMNQGLCNEFHIIGECEQWKDIRYPWLLMYDKRLPVDGDFACKPQNNWMNLSIAPKGQRHGFLDKSDNEWCWDTKHNGHWGVQSGGMCYLMVTPTGRIF